MLRPYSHSLNDPTLSQYLLLTSNNYKATKCSKNNNRSSCWRDSSKSTGTSWITYSYGMSEQSLMWLWVNWRIPKWLKYTINSFREASLIKEIIHLFSSYLTYLLNKTSSSTTRPRIWCRVPSKWFKALNRLKVHCS